MGGRFGIPSLLNLASSARGEACSKIYRLVGEIQFSGRPFYFLAVALYYHPMESLKKDKSKELFARASMIFPGGVNSPVRAFKSVGGEPFVVAKGQGPYLFDVDGNRYIDYINSWGPLVLGHAPANVVSTIQEQATRGTSYGACCELETTLGEIITQHFPSMQMLRFVSSGTEAGMSVVRLARGYTGRNKIVKCTGCYHGHVDSLLAQAGSGVATLGLPDCAGVPKEFTEHTLLAEFNSIESFEVLFEKFGRDIAAVILEPVMGNAGLILPSVGFLESLRSLTKDYGALLIFDEVMTGFRVSLSGAQGCFNVVPDLTMLGKVIGGGLPVGAFGGRREIMEALAPVGPVYQAGTLSGNPLAMAAGVETLRTWSSPGVFDSVAEKAKLLADGFVSAAREFDVELCASSLGTMFGYFFCAGPVTNYAEAKRADTRLFQKFFQRMLARGVYFAPSAFEAGFVSSAHSDEVLSTTITGLKEVFEELQKPRLT